LFSLGSVLYVMATGRPPFRASTTYAVLKRVVEENPRPIREVIPETPQWLCDIIAKLQNKRPEDRFQSAREVADFLANCEAQLKANAKPKEFARILKSTATSRWSGRWKWAVAAALLLPIFALTLTEIAGVTHWLRTHQRARDPLPRVNRPMEQSLPQSQGPTPNPLNCGDPEYTNTLGMEFKLIPAGKFTMGSPQDKIDRCIKLVGDGWERDRLPTEGPQHEVQITQPFYLGKTEVTVGQFRQFVVAEGYRVGDGYWINPGFHQTDDHPVVYVSWQNAVDFCNCLSAKEGKTYHLPTEAEWEYCCRAGKSGTRIATATTMHNWKATAGTARIPWAGRRRWTGRSRMSGDFMTCTETHGHGVRTFTTRTLTRTAP
jgi:hypothetical protein